MVQRGSPRPKISAVRPKLTAGAPWVCTRPTSSYDDDARSAERRRTRGRSGARGIGTTSMQHRVHGVGSTTHRGMQMHAWGLAQCAQGYDALHHSLHVLCIGCMCSPSPSPSYFSSRRLPSAHWPVVACCDVCLPRYCAWRTAPPGTRKRRTKRCLTAP